MRRYYEKTAPKYDRVMRLWDAALFRDGRAWACAQAQGRTLEIGIGTGRNLPHYREDVELVGIDPSAPMLELARERAKTLGRGVDLLLGDAQALNFTDASFDTVLSALTLCTIPDDRKAVGEVWRVLQPAGKFILLEHVRSPNPFVRVVQRLLDPLSVRFAADHLMREPFDHLHELGFEVETLERSRLGIVERTVARKPRS